MAVAAGREADAQGGGVRGVRMRGRRGVRGGGGGCEGGFSGGEMRWNGVVMSGWQTRVGALALMLRERRQQVGSGWALGVGARVGGRVVECWINGGT